MYRFLTCKGESKIPFTLPGAVLFNLMFCFLVPFIIICLPLRLLIVGFIQSKFCLSATLSNAAFVRQQNIFGKAKNTRWSLPRNISFRMSSRHCYCPCSQICYWINFFTFGVFWHFFRVYWEVYKLNDNCFLSILQIYFLSTIQR